MEREMEREQKKLLKRDSAKSVAVDPDGDGDVPSSPDDLPMVTLGQFIALDHAVFGDNPKSRYIGLG